MLDFLKTAKRRAKDETEARDMKCEPIAEQICQIIFKHKPSAKTDIGLQEVQKMYAPMATEINELMRDSGLTMSEVNYTWSIVQSMFDQVKNMSNRAVELALELVEQKYFAVDNMLDVPLQQLDDMLKYCQPFQKPSYSATTSTEEDEE